VKAGFAEPTLQRARGKAGAYTQKSEFGAGWVWTLTPRRRHEGAEGARTQELAPSAPSVAPSPTSNGQAPGRFDANRGEETVADRWAALQTAGDPDRRRFTR
jgi:hypothetical protein